MKFWAEKGGLAKGAMTLCYQGQLEPEATGLKVVGLRLPILASSELGFDFGRAMKTACPTRLSAHYLIHSERDRTAARFLAIGDH